MIFDQDYAVERLFTHGPLGLVLAAGTVVSLSRPAPQARRLGALFVGLIVYGAAWSVVAEVVLMLLNDSYRGGPDGDGNSRGLRYVWRAWYYGGILADAAIVLALAWAVATPRRRTPETFAGDAARDVQPSDFAGPLESGDTLEVPMSKKNHPPGPVPPGNRPGGDSGGPDTGAEDMPPQDGTGFAEQDEQRRLGGFTGKGEHSIQQPTPRKDGDAKAK